MNDEPVVHTPAAAAPPQTPGGMVLDAGNGTMSHFLVLAALAESLRGRLLQIASTETDGNPIKLQQKEWGLWKTQKMLRAAERELGWTGERLPRPAIAIGQDIAVQWSGGDFEDAVLGGRPCREAMARVVRLKQDGRATLMSYPTPEKGAILWAADFQWRVLWVKEFKVGVRPVLLADTKEEVKP